MTCGCIYVGGYGESYDDRSYAKFKRVTKSSVECVECGRLLKPLERYEYAYMVYEGRASIYITCKDCLSVRNEFFCDVWHSGFIWDYVSQHLEDIDGQISSECLLALTRRARDRMFDMIHEVWDNMDEGRFVTL